MLTLSRSVLPILVLTSLFDQTHGYAGYRTFIPNGEVVPHPCNPNYVWEGVGHVARGGGGERNSFGLDFFAEGKQWTEELCRMDSDGDGKSNGDELGDPDCVWQPGTEPNRTVGLSHPGICDPLDSELCMGKMAPNCEEVTFKCEAINEVDVFTYEIRIPPTPVPPRETTYMCMYVELPTDGDYHLIASTPIIDNINVMHHMLLNGCPDPDAVTAELGKPYECFMGATGCGEIIDGWTVGKNGRCFHPAAGFRVGNHEKGYRIANIQLHWNNPGFVANWTDSSGIKLYLTPNLRPYDAGVLMIGQLILKIPPQEENYVEQSRCSASCTRNIMLGSIYVLSVINHMHFLGRKALTQVVIPNKRTKYLAYDQVFNYDRPLNHNFQEPIRIDPGHELDLKCHFTSTSRTKTTYYGEGTSDEMCLAFLAYYPKENFTRSVCVSFGEIDMCEFGQPEIRGCNTRILFNSSHPETEERFRSLEENCDVGFCKKECIPVVKEINAHPCYQGSMRKYLLYLGGTIKEETALLRHRRFWSLLRSCDAEILKETFQNVVDQNECDTSAAVIPVGSLLVTFIGLPLYLLQ